MSQRKCPHCGEYVQKNSVTCPKCFREIPREQERSPEYVINDEKKDKKRKAPKTAVLLSVLPPFIGLLGLGMIYIDRKNREGYWFLVAGLLLFLPMLALIYMMRSTGILSTFLLAIVFVIVALIYISAALAALFQTAFGSVFKILRF